jgi:hypothetical protein
MSSETRSISPENPTGEKGKASTDRPPPPEDFIERFAKAGADTIIVHQEATPHLHRAIHKSTTSGRKPGWPSTHQLRRARFPKFWGACNWF